MKRKLALILAAGALLAITGFAGASTLATSVGASQSKFGSILVDGRGHSLYLFDRDRNGKSSCYGGCAGEWPPLIASGKPLAGAGAKASLLGTTKRADGRMQVTYDHHPLYTFVKDKRKGQTNGEGLSAFGAKWYAVSPAGARVVRHATVAPPPPANGIPQNNGGDHDSDNNGGPSDGDGNI